MTLTPGDGLDETARQRTRDQYALLKEVHGDKIIVDSDDEADFGYICSNEHVLLPAPGSADEDEVVRLVRYFNEDRDGDFAPTSVEEQPTQSRTSLSRRFVLPARVREPAPDGKDLLVTLDEIDNDIRVGFATPDHLIHISGKGLICPAAEPSETGDTLPWPYFGDDPDVGAEVDVVVIDTGWYDPTVGPRASTANLPWDWLSGVTGEPEHLGVYEDPSDLLYPYAGHGTFVAGVVRAVARGCRVHVLNLEIDQTVHGGGVFEADLVDRLYDALQLEKWASDYEGEDKRPPLPHIISMSAGCPTRLDLPSVAFEHWRQDLESKKADLVLVAAAGNNATAAGFWPASFEWATGVGSLDRDGAVSDFSNYGSSVDVLAVGRDVINAFPNGTYRLREGADKGKERYFTNYMSLWSGTSFSTPLVTGLIAAEISRQAVPSATQARDTVLGATTRYQAVYGGRTVPVVAPQLLV